MKTGSFEHYLDITDQICPMTFVRTKLLIEKMSSGDRATVRLQGAEPLQNVPRSVREHGDAAMMHAQVVRGGMPGDLSRTIIEVSFWQNAKGKMYRGP